MIRRVLPGVHLIIYKSIAVVKIRPLSIRDLLQSIPNLCDGLFFYKDLLRGECEGIEDDISICYVVKFCVGRCGVDVEKWSVFRNSCFAFPDIIQDCMFLQRRKRRSGKECPFPAGKFGPL